MIECKSVLVDFRAAVFHILILLSMFDNFHVRPVGGGGLMNVISSVVGQ